MLYKSIEDEVKSLRNRVSSLKAENQTLYNQLMETEKAAQMAMEELQEKYDAMEDGAKNAYGLYREYKDAEEQGLLLRLPDIKLYKTLYWIWGNEIMPVKYMGISHGCVDKHKKFHVVCRVHTKKDRTFTSGKKVITYKAGDKRFFYHDDIGKMIFLTMEAAEAALKGSTSEIRGNHAIDTGNPLTASLLNTMVEAGREALRGGEGE